MPEFMEMERDKEASCQKKLAPPRSVRAIGERGEIVWDMIAKRYPNAAPLLCQMETVIDRAENLLQRLKTDTYENDKGIGTSSTQILDFEEPGKQESTNSITESSSSNSEDLRDEVEEVLTRFSYDGITKMDDPSSSTVTSSAGEMEKKESAEQTPRVTLIDQSQNTEDRGTNESRKNFEKNETQSSSEKNDYRCNSGKNEPRIISKNDESLDSLNSASHDDKRDSTISVKTRQVMSLEDWDKVVGGKIISPKKKNDKTEVSNGPKERLDPSVNSTSGQTTKSDVPKVNEPSKIFEEKASVVMIGTTTRDIVLATTSKKPKTEIVLSPKKRGDTSSETSPDRKSTINPGSLATRKEIEKTPRNEKQKTGSGDDDSHSPKNRNVSQTPEQMLMDYAAQQNGKEIDFNVLKSTNKPNIRGIECAFAGYHAEAVESTELGARRNVATKILRMLAEDQIDRPDKTRLIPLSDDQMKFIVALGTDGTPEKAMRKLYKLCLEKNAPKPVYSVNNSYETDGHTYFAKCEALGKIGHGRGLRAINAKIEAAERLYTELLRSE